jgi:hypothetical protein
LKEDESTLSQVEIDSGKTSSQWVVMARHNADLGELATNPRWVPVDLPSGTQVWTDDYSNLLRVIKWN